MGKIYVNTDAVLNLRSNINGKAASCRNYLYRVNSVKDNLYWKVLKRRNINYRFEQLKKRIAHQSDMLYAFSRALGNVQSNVTDTDNRLRNDANRIMYKLNRMSYMNNYLSHASSRSKRIWEKDLRKYTFIASMFGGKILGPVLSSKPYISNTYKEYLTNDATHSKFDAFFMGKMKFSESKIHGSVGVNGTALGVVAAASAKGDVLGFDAKVKNSASWDEKKGEIGLKTKASATGYVAKGETSAAFGDLALNAKGSMITGTASGEAKATLWQDGEFSPALSIGATASAAVATGEVSTQYGDDTFNKHVKAEGSVLYAEAKASAGAGALRQNNSGQNVYGAEVKAGAEACVAKGEVSGGITVFGVKIDASVEGKALSVGAKASADITTEGMSADVGASLGLGAGVKVSVDWSKADWIEDVGDAIGNTANYIGTKVTQASDFVGNTACNVAESVGRWGKSVLSGAW